MEKKARWGVFIKGQATTFGDNGYKLDGDGPIYCGEQNQWRQLSKEHICESVALAFWTTFRMWSVHLEVYLWTNELIKCIVNQ